MYDSMRSHLIIEGARQHNLKNISLSIPHDQVTVVTGLSGSGKSSLAFDTIFAEGQWRYIESLSAYARMFIEKVDRPLVDEVRNIRPAIALEQRNPVKTSRSTVGTISEIYDYLRLLYAKIGRPVCPACGGEVARSQPSSVAEEILRDHEGKRIHVLFPVPVPPGELPRVLNDLLSRGFVRVKIGSEIVESARPSSPPPEAPEIFVVLDRIAVRPEERPRLTESLETAFKEGRGEATIELAGEGTLRYSQTLRCTTCGRLFEPPQPLLFSFNHPVGACKECNGFGNVLTYDEDLIVPDKTVSLDQGAIAPWAKPAYKWWMRQMLSSAKKSGINVKTSYGALTAADKEKLFAGTPDFYGINDFYAELEKKRYKLHVRVFLSRYRRASRCPSCGGRRLRPEALVYKIGGLDIAQLTALPVEELARWFRGLTLGGSERQTAEELLRQIELKLSFFLRVGLGYLTLDRQTRTLSGGEAQRVNLSNQLALKLTGTLYVLDEPSIGLHPRDTGRLAAIVRELAAGGNTVVMVEHDRALIESADHVVELGPGAGERGGRVVASGPKQEFLKSSCLTARYLKGETVIPLPARRRKQERKFLEITGMSEHNLKEIDLRLPLRTLTCVTGVSGSGKSTVVEDTLYRALALAFRIDSEKPGRYRELTGTDQIKGVKLIDQEPIGKSPRSNPVTYIKAFDGIRKIFSELPDAKKRGFTPSHFSFNVPGGRCEACQGGGFQKIEMYLFEDLLITCDQCGGKRYRPEILRVRRHGRSIADVLAMTVAEAMSFFTDHPPLEAKLRSLADVGLGYLRLGQPATTFSGGESQRIKIAHELGDGDARDVLYILDEPTTGLHFEDTRKLLDVLNGLVEAGNTVVVVEHNLDVIKTADWVIDLGPEGGDAGGRIVAQGTPEEVAEVRESHTGRYLREYLKKG
jgi:excinuclease ABC subunit A